MKRFAATLLLLFAVLAFGAAQTNEAQESTVKKSAVPKAVLAAFEKAYPHATVKGYAKEVEGGKAEYEIESREGAVSRDVSYAEDGTVLSVEESLPFAALPEAVRAAIAKEFPKQTASACEKVTKGSATQYEVVLKSGKKRTEAVFNADGTLVTKESNAKN
jgi:hypothetical protein